MNEAYCRDISIKTRSSLDVKRRNGDFVGAFPVYGYMKAEDNKNLLVPDPYPAVPTGGGAGGRGRPVQPGISV